MGIENIREIEFRYVVQYKDSSIIEVFFRTLDHIEKHINFPITPHQVIAKNQYTNKKDELGDKLYESDVVLLILPPNDEEIVGQIVWKGGGFVIEPFDNETVTYSLSFGKFKKLGDIYHNNGKKEK